ncbi:MAG TPA: hypothetical protein VHM91_08250 [Verrucomicrobiales bacterium]|nr:hypothetical protein [Verrucomicrobiales bacterium]
MEKKPDQPAAIPLSPPELPYRDTKPEGAVGFYGGINATFRFFLKRFGEAGWRRYLQDLGRGYFAPVNRQWHSGGLGAVARYWRAFFAAEPGAEVAVIELPDRVEVRVKQCPAIKHLRGEKHDIVREYCRHCYYLGAARAEASGLTMRLGGGNGSCIHTYARAEAALPPQDLAAISEASS